MEKVSCKTEDGFEIAAINAAALVTKLLQITSGAVYATNDNQEKRVEEIHQGKLKALQKLHKK